jgi:casein kinase II subunit beta
MEEDALESSSEEGSSLDEPSWVSWFCMLRNHEFFCEVDPAFVQDRFNLYGLKEIVGPLYGEAMTMILGYAPTGALVHRCSRLTTHWGASGPAPGLLCA